MLHLVFLTFHVWVQAMCLAWLAQLMGVTMVHANLRHWFKLFYASICTFVLFGLDQVITLHTLPFGGMLLTIPYRVLHLLP